MTHASRANKNSHWPAGRLLTQKRHLLWNTLQHDPTQPPSNLDARGRHPRALFTQEGATHSAPFLHGCAAHSSMLTSHVTPSKPAAHAQRKAFSSFSHVAAFRQGELAHSSTSTQLPASPGNEVKDVKMASRSGRRVVEGRHHCRVKTWARST